MDLVEYNTPVTVPSGETRNSVARICEKYNLDYDEVCHDIINIFDDEEDLIQADVVVKKPNLMLFY